MEATLSEGLLGLIHGIGRQTIDILLPIFSLFKDETVAPTIATLMVAVAGILAVVYAIGVGRVRREIGRRIVFLKSCDSRAGFLSRFAAFDALMTASPLLRHGWAEYRQTLLPRQDESQEVESTVRPSDFINLTELEHTGLKLSWFHGVPGVFVGLGLLFTFLGLVAALFFAAQAIHAAGSGGTAADAAAQSAIMQGALAQLLSSATFKFWTSIAGLGSSIFLGILHRWLLRVLERDIDALCREIERCTLTVTSELLASRQITAIRAQSAQSAAQWADFSGRLAGDLGDSLDAALRRSLPEAMRGALEPLAGKLDAMSRTIVGINENAIRTMTREFGSVVSSHAGAELHNTAEALVVVKEALLETSRAVSGSGSGLSGEIAGAAAELRAAARAITDSMGGITAAVEGDVGRTRDSLENQLRAVTQGLSTTAETIRASMAEMGVSMRSSTEESGGLFAGRIADAVFRIEAAAVANSEAISQVVGQMRSATSEAAVALAGKTASVMASVQRTSEQMEQAVSRMSQQMQSSSLAAGDAFSARMAGSMERMEAAALANSDAIQQMVMRLQSVSAQAAGAVTAETSAVVASMRGSAEQMAGSVLGMTETLRQSSASAGAVFADQVAASANRIGEVSTANALAIEQVLGQLRTVALEATGAMTTGTGAVVSTMGETTERMARTMSEITRQIQQRSEDGVSDLSQTLRAAAQALWDAADHNAGRIGEAVAQVGRTLEQQGQEAATKLVTATDQVLTRFQGGVAGLSGSVDALWQGTDKVVDGMAAVESKIAGHARILDDTNRTAGETKEALATAAKTLVEAGLPLHQAGATLIEAIDNSTLSVETAAMALDETHRQNSRLAAEMTATLAELQRLWTLHQSRFTQADAGLENTLRQLVELIDGQVRRVDGVLTDGATLLAGNIRALQETATLFTAATTALVEASSGTAAAETP